MQRTIDVEAMLRMLKEQFQGFKYLLTHPRQMKWIIIREFRYGQRNRNKQMWIEWQKYDSQMHISMMHAHSNALILSRASVLSASRKRIISEMISRIGTGLTILDVGCGDGVISEPIVKMGNDVISVELPKIANIAQKCRVPSVVAGDAEQLPFASNSFDVVLASEVVEHLWKPQDFLDDAYRILRTNGYLIIETPEGKGSLYYDSHKHYFTEERLKQMLGEKFIICKVKRLEPKGALTPTIIMLLRKSLITKDH